MGIRCQELPGACRRQPPHPVPLTQGERGPCCDAVRQFVDNEIRPHREELEHGDLPPYDLLRKLYSTFGMDVMARESFKRRIEAEKAASDSELAGAPSAREAGTPPRSERDPEARGGGMTLLPIVELCKCSPGMVTAMGVSVGLTSAAIMAKGTVADPELPYSWTLTYT